MVNLVNGKSADPCGKRERQNNPVPILLMRSLRFDLIVID